MTPFRRFLLVLLFLVPVPALGQTEPAGTMPTTVVTADRFPTDPDKVTSSYTVVPQEEMQRRQLRTAGEVLKTVPGISVQQSGGPGTQTSVFVRGSNSNHVLVLIDGVTVNDPSTPNGGYVDIDPYRNLTFAARLGFEINDNTQFNWFGRYIDTKLNYDQVGQEDPNANGYTSQFYTRGEIEGSYFNGRWKPVVGVNYSTITRHDLDYASPQVPFPFTVDALFNGRRLQGDFKNLVTITDQVEVIAGLDYDRQWAYSNTLGSVAPGTLAAQAWDIVPQA